MISELLDHLWQSTLFLAAAGGLTLLLHNNSARSRYLVWLAASIKFLIPFALLTGVGSLMSRWIVVPRAAMLDMLKPGLVPFSAPEPVIVLPALQQASVTGANWPLYLLIIWAMGFGGIAALWLSRSVDLILLARKGRPLAGFAPVPVRVSPRQLEPGLIGVFRPLILLPEGIETQLSQEELDTILAHELCHLHRRDNLTAALHMFVSALFWFWPPVWLLGSRLTEERERACDEAVAAASDPRTYANAILKVCKFYLHSPLACVAGVSGGALKLRLEAIMEQRLGYRIGRAKAILLTSCAALAIVLPIGAGAIDAASHPPLVAMSAASPHLGTKEFMLREIDAVRNGKPDYASMTPGFAQSVRDGLPQVQPLLMALGKVKSVTYRGHFPDQEEIDVYNVQFSSGPYYAFAVGAPNAEGKFNAYIWRNTVPRDRYDRPSPGTEDSLRRYIAAMELGKPNYDDMTPEKLADFRLTETASIKMIQGLGALKSLTFIGVNLANGDVYHSVFEKGKAIWNIQPLTADGKVSARGFQIVH